MDARAPSVFEMASEQFPPSEASLSNVTHARIVEQKVALALSQKKGSKRLNLVRLGTEVRRKAVDVQIVDKKGRRPKPTPTLSVACDLDGLVYSLSVSPSSLCGGESVASRLHGRRPGGAALVWADHPGWSRAVESGYLSPLAAPTTRPTVSPMREHSIVLLGRAGAGFKTQLVEILAIIKVATFPVAPVKAATASSFNFTGSNSPSLAHAIR